MSESGDRPSHMGLRIPNLLPRRRAHRVLIGVLLLLVAAWFVVPQLFVPKIRAKLQGMIAGHLDARLEIGRLMYAPPFGVRARDVRLIGGSGAGGEHAGLELLKVRKLDLKLARLPFRKGPLVIQNITVTDPEVHLVRTQPSPALGLPDDADPDAARAKLSDMFELRHLGIHNGRFVYEDRSRPGLPPVVWKDVDVGMATTPKSKAVYGYTLEAIHGDLARLTASGSFDLDRLVIDLGALHLEAQRTSAQEESPLPAQVQQALRDYRVAGQVVLDAAGHFELRDPSAAKFKAALELRDASAYLPRWDRSLDRIALKLNMENAGPRAVRIHIDQFEAASGDSVARIDKGQATLDTRANTWNVSDVAGKANLGSQKDTSATAPRGAIDFTLAAQGILRPATGQTLLAPQDVAFLAYPRALSFQPRGWPAPLLNFGGGGSVRKDCGTSVVLFENLTFSYGGDPATLASARLPLPPDLSDLRRAWRLEEISGTLDFRRPGPRYPGKFGNVVDSLRPVGPFSVGRDSWYAVAQVGEGPRGPRRKADWFFSVA